MLFVFQKHFQFNIDPWEPVIAAKTGSHFSVMDDASQLSGGEQISAVAETWSEESDHNQPR